jgi:hypothetical protein
MRGKHCRNCANIAIVSDCMHYGETRHAGVRYRATRTACWERPMGRSSEAWPNLVPPQRALGDNPWVCLHT